MGLYQHMSHYEEEADHYHSKQASKQAFQIKKEGGKLLSGPH